MKSLLTYATVLCGLALVCSSSARAERGLLETEHERTVPERSTADRATTERPSFDRSEWEHSQAHSDRSTGIVVHGAVAPEVDPSMAVAGLALLAGSLTVLRSRRRSS